MSGRELRAEDNNAVLLDNDGMPIAELEADSVDEVAERGATVAELAAAEESWRYGHVIVDEAQDLTPMQWRMVARRARGGSMTVVGDLAQRSIGEPGTWRDHLPPTITDFSYQELTINYRSPAQVNDIAAMILAELAPDLRPAQSIRAGDDAPRTIEVDDVASAISALLEAERVEVGDGRVIAIDVDSAWQAKGLEFDSVIVVEPAAFLDKPNGLSLLYVAVTRSTNRLTILHSRPLPTFVNP